MEPPPKKPCLQDYRLFGLFSQKQQQQQLCLILLHRTEYK